MSGNDKLFTHDPKQCKCGDVLTAKMAMRAYQWVYE